MLLSEWLVILSALGQQSTNDLTSETSETTTFSTVQTTDEGTELTEGSSSLSSTDFENSTWSTKPLPTTTPYRICGALLDTDTCHFEDSPDLPCDICHGFSCPTGRRCLKRRGKCEAECVCNNPVEIPDWNETCRAGCLVNPCQNNGTCGIDGTRQVCQCVPGFDGHSCENVKNLCLQEKPLLCPSGPHECTMHAVNNYSCVCAPGYYQSSDKYCEKVGHSVILQMHFVETPYSEVYNDPKRSEYEKVRKEIKQPFTLIYGSRLVGVEFRNFTQGSLVANLNLILKPAENGSQLTDEYKFKEHILKCSLKQSTSTPECFGTLGRIFLPKDAWLLQDERCDSEICPEGTRCEAVEGQADKTRCGCASGYVGYGSTVDSTSRNIELCRDVDECSTIAGVCQDDEVCINTKGNFLCTAPCKDIKCPGNSKCVVGEDKQHRCDCNWIYAGSSCSFPWTLIFMITTIVLLLCTAFVAFLLWRTVSNDKKGRW